MIKISVCIIMRNEEKNIVRCLKSVRSLADEVVLIDTGSSDLTKSICHELGFVVHDFKWENDFQAARNFSVSKASGDYILILDADEVARTASVKKLKNYIKESVSDIFSVRLTHFTGYEPYNDKRSYISFGHRLFKNDRINFVGSIHETIEVGNKTIDKDMPFGLLEIKHYGYTQEAYASKNARNLSMLIKNEMTGWDFYHVAAQFYRAGDLINAGILLNSAIIDFLNKKQKPPSLVYKLKYDMLITSKSYNLAAGIESAILLYPDYVDLHFYKGILQYAGKNYDEAINTFSYCLILGESNAEYLILSGVGSFLALLNLAKCYNQLGNKKAADQATRQAKGLYREATKRKYFKEYLLD